MYLQAQVRGRARYNFHPESSSEDVESLLHVSGNTPRHNNVRQITSTTETPSSNQRDKVNKPSITSRRVDIIKPTGAPISQTSNTVSSNSPRKAMRAATLTSAEPVSISRTTDNANSQNSSRIVKRKKIRLSKSGNRHLSLPGNQTIAKTKPEKSKEVPNIPTFTSRIPSSSTSKSRPTSSIQTTSSPLTTITESRIHRSSSQTVPTTTPTSTVASSAASKLIGFPTASTLRRLTTVQPSVDKTTTKVSQLSSLARRPTTRALDKKPNTISTTTKPQPIKSRGNQRSKITPKNSPTRVQIEEFDEENYPEPYKIALKAKLSAPLDESNEVSDRALSKPKIDQPTTSKPNSVRVTFPKLEKLTTPDGSTNAYDGPDPNSIHPATYVDYQNSSPKYSSRIRHNENRVQEPSHKVRARSQNLSNPRNGNQLLEANGVAGSSSSILKEPAASAVSLQIHKIMNLVFNNVCWLFGDLTGRNQSLFFSKFFFISILVCS